MKNNPLLEWASEIVLYPLNKKFEVLQQEYLEKYTLIDSYTIKFTASQLPISEFKRQAEKYGKNIRIEIPEAFGTSNSFEGVDAIKMCYHSSVEFIEKCSCVEANSELIPVDIQCLITSRTDLSLYKHLKELHLLSGNIGKIDIDSNLEYLNVNANGISAQDFTLERNIKLEATIKELEIWGFGYMHSVNLESLNGYSADIRDKDRRPLYFSECGRISRFR
jgi:hypothetical protein